MNKIIWITGAGSGIGKALVHEYDRSGNLIILSGRNTEQLKEVAKQLKCEYTVQTMDVTDEAQVKLAVENVLDRYKKVDILINNAGISQRSLAIDTAMETGRKIMDVNFFGAVQLTKALLPRFIEQNHGNIVVISSISGKFGFPQRSFYAASKHALHGYFESLSLELSAYNIHVTLVCPGRIKTDISMNALKGDGSKHGVFDDAQKNGMSAQRCAGKVVKAVERGKKEVYIGGNEVLMVYFKRYIPFLFRYIASRVNPN